MKFDPNGEIAPVGDGQAVPADSSPNELTTNSINPATGTGYGLYRMGSYDFDQGRVTKPEIQVPYNRVQDAMAVGYKLHPDEAPRYQNDTAHNGPASRVAGQVKSILSRMTAPMPDTPLTGNPLQQTGAALANVEKLPFNVVNRTLRGLAGLPQGVVQSTWDFTQGRPEGVDPFAMAENSYKGLQQDTTELGPMAAFANLGGDATTMYLAGKVGSPIAEAGTKAMLDVADRVRNFPKTAVRAATNTGSGPIKKLVKDTQAENEKIESVNQDRLERQRQDQAKADYDHRANLLKLRQNYEQSVRDATEKARTGTAEDRAAYQSKQLAAKQKYEQDVRDQTQKFQTERAKAEQTNAEAQRAHNQKIGETAQNNKAATEAERAKTAQNAKLQVGGSQLIYGLRQLDKALRDRAATLYDAIREKVGGQTLPGTALAQAAKTAMSKISGTSVTPSVFRDILGKYPEADPEALPFTTSTGGTTMISKGHPMYNFLKENGAAASTPVTFKDLQGYHSELGAELSKGTLPGDVYQATRDLQESVTDMMQDMAKKADANNDLISARKFYREYMDTFHEPTGPSSSGSPVAQALLAKDPLVAVDKFAGDSGDRGIAILRKYSDSLANLAQDTRQTAQTNVTVPARKTTVGTSPKITPVPAGANLPLPPVVETSPSPRALNLPLPPVIPEPKTVPVELKPKQTISTPDIVAARRAAAETRVNKIANRGQWAATWPLFQAARALWGGHIPSIPTM